MLENLNKYEILLASNSPRRKELLKGLDIDFKTTSLPEIDESFPSEMNINEIPLYISINKSDAYKRLMKNNTLLITADTIVCSNNKVLGKPKDIEGARNMLRYLSAKTHKVITGVYISTLEKNIGFISVTNVTFAEITEDEINYYIDKYKPYDKAGSYGIQEWIGFIAVEKIEGSYFNVMGLPVQKLYSELKKF